MMQRVGTYLKKITCKCLRIFVRALSLMLKSMGGCFMSNYRGFRITVINNHRQNLSSPYFCGTIVSWEHLISLHHWTTSLYPFNRWGAWDGVFYVIILYYYIILYVAQVT